MTSAILAAVTLTALSSCERREASYERVSLLETVTGPGDSLLEPMGVAVTTDGTLFVADARRAEVIKYAPDGTFLTAWNQTSDRSTKLSRPIDLAVGADGTIYVVDFDLDRVFTFESDGVPIAAWGEPGSDEGEFASPSGIGIAADGTVWIADFQNHRVQAFQPDGTFLKSFGSEGHGAGDLHYPTDVTVVDGTLYVSDAYNDRVALFSRNGEWVAEQPQQDGIRVPVCVAVTVDGTIHVSDSENHRLIAFDRHGKITETLNIVGQRPTGLNTPAHLVATPNGRLYIADPAHGRVLILRWSG